MRETDRARELFLKTMSFEPSERTLKWEFAYWGGALNRWYKEGPLKRKNSSKEYNYGDCIIGSGDLGNYSPSWSGEIWERDINISNYFDLDEGIAQANIYYWFLPHFEKKIISEDKKYIELIDFDGIRKKIFKDNSSMPFWLEWPLKDRNDWENIKRDRLSLDNISERFKEDLDEFSKNHNDTLSGILDAPVGFFGSLRYLMGEERLYLMYYDDPALIKDILEHLCNLWIAISEELTEKIDFDIAIFWEDMAGKQGSLISPSLFKEFMMPNYKRLIGFLKSKGIKYFSVDCDGKIDGLIPLFLEAGINIMYPFERQASNNLVEIRKKYPELGMLGGFDKNSLYKGKQYIDNELENMSWLISRGGYIPFADHAIPPNSSWENFKYYRNKLNSIIETTRLI